jgi:hypothetical protein
MVPASFFIDQQGKFAAWASYGRFAELEANRKPAVGQIKALYNRLSVSVGLLSWNDYQGNIPGRVLPYLYMIQEFERGVMPTENQGSERYSRAIRPLDELPDPAFGNPKRPAFVYDFTVNHITRIVTNERRSPIPERRPDKPTGVAVR